MQFLYFDTLHSEYLINFHCIIGMYAALQRIPKFGLSATQVLIEKGRWCVTNRRYLQPILKLIIDDFALV